MEEKEIKNSIIKIIEGLRLVLRHKEKNLTLLISMSNGFLNQNYPITEQIVEYDLKNNNNTTKEQQNKFEKKFRNAKNHLDIIIRNMDQKYITKSKYDNIKSFQDISKTIDKKLENYQKLIIKLIENLKQKNKTEILQKINIEIKNIIK